MGGLQNDLYDSLWQCATPVLLHLISMKETDDKEYKND